MSKVLSKKKSSPDQQLTNIVLGILVVFFVLVVVLLFTLKPQSSSSWKDQNNAWRGNAQAKVVIHEFSDYSCPACAAATQQIEQQLYARYQDRVQFIHKDFPLHGKDAASYTAALAARCAQKQDAFWPMHVLLFAKQNEWKTITTLADLQTKLVSYAATVGLDSAAFETCLTQKETQALVDSDADEAAARGVTAAPTFFVNEQKITGYNKLEETIQQQLALYKIQ